MTLILIIIAGLVLGGGLWWLAEQDVGYIYIDVLGYQLQTPAVVALVVLILGFIALYIVVRLLGALWRTPKRVRQWSDKRLTESAHAQTARGYTALIEGDFEKAERKLIQHADKHSTPVLNYIAAANAAQQRKDYVQRDRYLRQALHADPDGRRAIVLSKARLQYEAGQLTDSQATLVKLRETAPESPKILKLLVEVRRELGDWQGVHALLPQARQLKAYDADALNSLERETQQHNLAAPPSADEVEAPKAVLESRWKALKSKQRKDTSMVRTFVEQLIDNNEIARAEQELRVTLKREWDPELAYLYGKAVGESPEDQLATAIGWESSHHDDSDLMLTIGRLAMASGQWEEAKTYLQRAVGLGGRDEARVELGGLLESMGETDAAMSVYREGMRGLVSREVQPRRLPAPQVDEYSNESK